MKKNFSFLCVFILILSLFFSVYSSATDIVMPPESTAPSTVSTDVSQETSQTPPFLTFIEFNGASIDGEFKADVFEHNLNMSSHEEFSIKNYKCDDVNAKVQIDFITNKSGIAKGAIISVSNSAGSKDYKFLFNSVREITKTSDASLMSLSFNFGELSPTFSSDTYKYTLYLPMDLETLSIDAITGDENATIRTPSEIALNKENSSSISVIVSSSDGTVSNTYRLNVKRVKKTISQIKVEMASPDYVTFVEIPFYETAPFYIGTGVTAFVIAMALVLYFSLKKKKPTENDTESEDAALDNGAKKEDEKEANSTEIPQETVDQTTSSHDSEKLSPPKEAAKANDNKAENKPKTEPKTKAKAEIISNKKKKGKVASDEPDQGVTPSPIEKKSSEVVHEEKADTKKEAPSPEQKIDKALSKASGHKTFDEDFLDLDKYKKYK